MLVLALSIVVTLAYKIRQLEYQPVNIALPFHFDVERGASVYTIAEKLESTGVVDDAFWVRLLVRLELIPQNIKEGEYLVEVPVSLPALFGIFASGKVVTYQITFPEGWTLKQILAEMQLHAKLTHRLTDLGRSEVASQLGVSGSAEGWIFPDTYHYAKGDTDISILRRAHNIMTLTLADAWSKRAVDNLSKAIETPYDALILASLIERESSVAAEREIISSVFHNRLNKNIRLQTDPTVIYALGDAYDGNIRRSDLRFDSPFNTYVYRGLPPTPIAMPGKGAIIAALNPAQTDFYYFVAKGNGYHEFSQTLEEHNKAVRDYQIKKRANNYKSTPDL